MHVYQSNRTHKGTPMSTATHVEQSMSPGIRARGACPARGAAQPHQLMRREFGGAFCLSCNSNFPQFHMHYKQLCVCQPADMAPVLLATSASTS